MEHTGYVPVGRILKTFGVRGEVKVFLDITLPETDETTEEGFKPFEAFFIQSGPTLVPWFVSHLRNIHSGQPMLKLDDLQTREEAQALCGKVLYLPEAEVDLEEPEGQYDYLIGYLLADTELGAVGEIEAIIDLPMHELAQLTVKGREVLVPLHPDHITAIDREAKRITLRIPEGLLDIYLGNED